MAEGVAEGSSSRMEEDIEYTEDEDSCSSSDIGDVTTGSPKPEDDDDDGGDDTHDADNTEGNETPGDSVSEVSIYVKLFLVQ